MDPITPSTRQGSHYSPSFASHWCDWTWKNTPGDSGVGWRTWKMADMETIPLGTVGLDGVPGKWRTWKKSPWGQWGWMADLENGGHGNNPPGDSGVGWRTWKMADMEKIPLRTVGLDGGPGKWRTWKKIPLGTVGLDGGPGKWRTWKKSSWGQWGWMADLEKSPGDSGVGWRTWKNPPEDSGVGWRTWKNLPRESGFGWRTWKNPPSGKWGWVADLEKSPFGKAGWMAALPLWG